MQIGIIGTPPACTGLLFERLIHANKPCPVLVIEDVRSQVSQPVDVLMRLIAEPKIHLPDMKKQFNSFSCRNSFSRRHKKW